MRRPRSMGTFEFKATTPGIERRFVPFKFRVPREELVAELGRVQAERASVEAADTETISKLDARIVQLKTLVEDAPKGSFEGYGSVFGVEDSYADVVKKGAFKTTLRDWKKRKKLPKLLLQHGGGFWGGGADDMVPIGKWDEMLEDETGLFCRGHLFDIETDRAIATYAAMKEGELDGLSIGFRTKKSEMDEDTNIRTLTEIELWEVSLVTFPANDPARVSDVKDALDLPTEREFERWLQREAGFTEAIAKTIIAKGYRQVRREASHSDTEACGELVALLQQRGAIFSGDQRP